MKPTVSVILATYNRGYILRQAIMSVLMQTYKDLELIVVDDGSTDNTQDLLRSIKDPRLRVVTLKHNSGISAARNAGIRIARGEFIGSQDSDDVWLAEKLEKQVKALATAPSLSCAP